MDGARDAVLGLEIDLRQFKIFDHYSTRYVLLDITFDDMLDCKATHNLVNWAEASTIVAVYWRLTARVTFIATMIPSFHGH